MTRSFSVVMLAGALEPPPLRRQLDVPLVCLPVGESSTLLDAWLSTLGRTRGCSALRIVVSTEEDARTVARMTEALPCCGPVTVIAEPAARRGSGGLVRDLSTDLADGSLVAIEAHCLPPRSLEPLLQGIDHDTDGVVGAGRNNEPAGVYAFDQHAIESVPTIGYYDLKEQLLPALSRRGAHLRLVQVTDHVIRIRDRQSYLKAVRAGLESNSITRSVETSVPRSAKIAGSSIVGSQATIEHDVVIFDSVVLGGGTVRAGAKVVRSIVADGAEVPANSLVVDSVVTKLGTEPSIARLSAGAVQVLPVEARRSLEELGTLTWL